MSVSVLQNTTCLNLCNFRLVYGMNVLYEKCSWMLNSLKTKTMFSFHIYSEKQLKNYKFSYKNPLPIRWKSTMVKSWKQLMRERMKSSFYSKYMITFTNKILHITYINSENRCTLSKIKIWLSHDHHDYGFLRGRHMTESISAPQKPKYHHDGDQIPQDFELRCWQKTQQLRSILS